MRPLVSVIIPVYNGEEFVGQAIDSVVRQTFEDFEVLVVDDGSTDNSRQIVEDFAKADARIQYIRQENKGVSAARNHGFRRSRGRFLAFLDADDIWLSDNLASKLQEFKNSDAGLVHSDGLIIDEFSRKSEKMLRGNQGDLLDAMLQWDGTQIPGPSSVLIRRDVLEKIGEFDESMSTSADLDLFIRIASRFRIGRVERVTWYYRIHGKNMHKNIAAMESDVLRLYEKLCTMELFKNRKFKNRCFSVMYLILAASWAGDGKNPKRSMRFLLRAIRSDPQVTFNVLRKTLKRLILR